MAFLQSRIINNILLLQKRYSLKKKSVLFPIILWYGLLICINLILIGFFLKLNVDNIGLASVLSSGISAIFIIFIYRKHFSNSQNLSIKKTLLTVFFTFGLYAFVISFMDIFNIVKYFPSYNNVVGVIQSVPKIVYFICIVVLSPICEELLFRGVVYSSLKERMKVSYAIILQAFLFGISHGNLLQGVYAFFIGIIFALLLEYTDNLYSICLCHIIFNLCNDIFNLSLLKVLFDNSVVLFIFAIFMMICCGGLIIRDVKK